MKIRKICICHFGKLKVVIQLTNVKKERFTKGIVCELQNLATDNTGIGCNLCLIDVKT